MRRAGRLLPVVLASALFVPVLGALGALPRASADEAAYRHLVDRATRVLKEAEGLHAAGRRDLGRERARRAAALLAQADRQKPTDANVAFLSVQAGVFAEDAEAARLWITRYLRRTPYGEKDPNLHYARALVWLRLDGRPGQAVRSLDRMAELSPRGLTRPAHVLLYEALTTLARSLVDAGHVGDAVQRFRRASDVARRMGDASKEMAARANGAITLLESGRAADAEKLLARLHLQQPANAVFAFYLGRSLRLQDRPAEAAPLLRKAAAAVDAGRVAPQHADLVREAWLELGLALRQLATQLDDAERKAEAYGGARRAFERYTTLTPRHGLGWHHLGRLLALDLDLPLDAVPALERAYALDPVCDGALRLLIRIAGQSLPPPGETPDGWRERREAWVAELKKNVEAWEAEREKRRADSRIGTDGCP